MLFHKGKNNKNNFFIKQIKLLKNIDNTNQIKRLILFEKT